MRGMRIEGAVEGRSLLLAPRAVLALALFVLAGAVAPHGAGSTRAEATQDGQLQIAFLSDRGGGGGDLFAMNVDGSRVRRLTTGDTVTSGDLTGLGGLFFDSGWGSPASSPDGKQLVFIGETGGGGLYVINTDGTDLRRLVSGPVLCPTWSPDGRSIAFSRLRGAQLAFDLYVVPSDGGTAKKLAAGHCPRWSPDGIRIVFTRNARAPSSADPGFDLWIMMADGSSQRLLSRRGFAWGWSHDGTQIAFTRRNGDVDDVWVRTMSSGKQRPVARGADWPVWSPTKARIAFVGGRGGSGRPLGLVNSDGTGARWLTNGRRDEGYPAWSPDGRKLLFSREFFQNVVPGLQWDVFVVTANGTGERRLTSFRGGDDISPIWSTR